MGDFSRYSLKIRRIYKNKPGVNTTPIIVYIFQSTPATKKIRRQLYFILTLFQKQLLFYLCTLSLEYNNLLLIRGHRQPYEKQYCLRKTWKYLLTMSGGHYFFPLN